MAKSQSEEHYLASLVPPSVRATAGAGLGRRGFLRGRPARGRRCSLPGLLAACGGDDDAAGGGGTSGGEATGTVTIGSNASDEVPKNALRRGRSPPSKPPARSKTKVNTVDHNTFQEKSTTTCRAARTTSSPGSPATGCGSSPRRASPATSATSGTSIGGDFSDAFKKASTGDDGKQYFVPLYNYPWADVLPQEPVERERLRGAEDLDELTALGDTDEEGRPVPDRVRRQGRLAGDGHLRHPQHAHQRLRLPRQPDGRQGVLDRREGQGGLRHLGALLPYHQEGSLGRTWQEAAQSLVQKKSGMYLLGTFVVAAVRGADLDDLDFFAFPEIDSEHGTDAVEAPIDGFMMSPKPKNEDGAKALLEYLGSAAAQDIYLKSDPGNVGGEQRRGHQRLQRAAEEVGRDHRLDGQHRAVPRPRHPAGLRVDRDDPGAAGLHQGPERHRRADLEHRGPEEVDLRLTPVDETVAGSGSSIRSAPCHRRCVSRPPAGRRIRGEVW